MKDLLHTYVFVFICLSCWFSLICWCSVLLPFAKSFPNSWMNNCVIKIFKSILSNNQRTIYDLNQNKKKIRIKFCNFVFQKRKTFILNDWRIVNCYWSCCIINHLINVITNILLKKKIWKKQGINKKQKETKKVEKIK